MSGHSTYRTGRQTACAASFLPHGCARGAKGPELLPVRVGRQICVQQSEQRKGYDDPAVATILAHTSSHISASEDRGASHYEDRDRDRDERRVEKKAANPPQPSTAKAR